MSLDPKIRFVTILDKAGTILFGGQREGIQNYLSEDEQKKSIKHVTNTWFSRNQCSTGIGDGKYAMVEYDKVKRFTFPLNTSHIVYVTAEPDVDHNAFVNNFLKIKNSF